MRAVVIILFEVLPLALRHLGHVILLALVANAFVKFGLWTGFAVTWMFGLSWVVGHRDGQRYALHKIYELYKTNLRKPEAVEPPKDGEA